MPFGTVIFSYLGSHFTKKERNRRKNFFSSSVNAIWLTLLKYQEIDQSQKTKGFCVADFAMLSDARRLRLKIFRRFIWIKEPCI